MHVYKSTFPPVDLFPDRSLWNHVWSNINNVPDTKPAIIYAPTGESIDRATLRSTCARLAHGYRRVLELQPGQTFCVFSPNSLFYHAICLAGQCAGLVVSPANAAYTASELRHQIEDSDSAAVVCAPSLLHIVLEATATRHWGASKQRSHIVLACRSTEAGTSGYRTIEDLLGPEELQPHQYNDPKEELAYLCYSSGTTGLAKGVMTTVYNMTSVLSGAHYLPGNADDVSFAFLPFSHIYGLTCFIHLPILEGQTVIIVPRWELQTCCWTIQRYRPTLFFLVPPVALQLVTGPTVSRYDLSSLKYIVTGAAPMSAELQERVSKKLGAHVSQSYGLTETSPTSHYCPWETPRAGSCGKLLPTVEARCVDPVTLQDVKPGEEGELWMKGPIVMKGYHKRPDATCDSIVQGGWLRTGDIAKFDNDHYCYITDRIKELIKYKGYQVPPAELEGLLLQHPRIKDAGVVGLYDDSQSTELPRAYVVLDGSRENGIEKQIQAWIAERVARHKQLRGGVVIIEAIPKSPSGKILRRVLRDQAKKEVPKPQPSRASKL